MSVSSEFLNQLGNRFTYEEHELINHFFITFSRFECALKQSIVFARIANHRGVEADWNKFIDTIKPSFNKNRSPELKYAVEFLLNQPPQKQFLRNNSIVFDNDNLKGKSEINRLKTSIKTIRNNLFHGGKFKDFHPETSRNYPLLKNAIVIMDEWIILDERVKEAFLTPIP